MTGGIAYRRIRPAERAALGALVHTVLDGLERKDFFISLGDEGIDEMLDEARAVAYGAYDGDRLVGTAQLYLGDPFVDQIKALAGIPDARAAELGGALVLREYRGRGIMKKLAAILVAEARRLGYEYVVSTAHPENIASQRGLVSCGERLVARGQLEGHERNVYALHL